MTPIQTFHSAPLDQRIPDTATSRRTAGKTKYKPVMDEDQAREIVLCRIGEAESPTGPRTLSVFARQMYEYGLTRRIVSASLLSQLFSGNMYPHLKDREGRPFDWKLVPRATRGRRPGGQSKKGDLSRLQRQVNHLSLVVRTLCDRMGLSDELDPFEAPEADDAEVSDTPPVRKPRYVNDILVEDDADLVETPASTPPPEDEDEDDGDEPVNTIPQPSVPPPRRS